MSLDNLKGVGDTKGVLTKLKKSYGDSFQFGDSNKEVDVISTGSLSLDIALGIGGYPRGRITQLAGWESAGKTTHSLFAIANLQKVGGSVAYIDTEYALDPRWAEKLGVDMSSITWIQPDDLEAAGEIAVDLAESGSFDMIVMDSVAGAPIQAVVDGELGDANMGKRAKIMSTFLPKLNGPVARNGVWMLFTNQLRDSLNIRSPKPVTPGGHALSFHASITVWLRAKMIVPPGKTEASHVEITATVEKNKLSPPRRVASYQMDFDGNVNVVEELAGIITNPEYLDRLDIARSGAYYTLPDAMLIGTDLRFHGKAEIASALTEVESYERARAYVLEKLGAQKTHV